MTNLRHMSFLQMFSTAARLVREHLDFWTSRIQVMFAVLKV